MKKKNFKHLSLFSGCGGMDLGVHGGFVTNKAFFSKEKGDGLFKLKKNKFDTVFANDIKKESYTFWRKNFPEISHIFKLGSIVDLVKYHKKHKNIFPNKVDLLTGGFPCQDFSISGLRKGFSSHKSHKNINEKFNKNENRGSLYIWMKEVIAITKPKIFIAENVKGLLNMEGVIEKITRDFSLINDGYKVYHKELFAPDYGIPQSRKRVFIIGINNNWLKINKIKYKIDDLFPDIEFSKKNDLFLNKYPKSEVFFSKLNEPENETRDQSQKIYSKAKYLKGLQGSTEVNANGLAPTIRSEHHGNIEYRYLNKKYGGKSNSKHRRLTVRECARIQTFPDNFKFVFKELSENLSASSAYKLIGDAVPPVLAYKIIKKIEKLLIKYS